jgi:putative phage-type endonuclease
MPLVEIEQGSAEWLQMRTGCVTGSRMGDVMAKLKRKEGEAQCRQDYKAEIVCETLTGRAADHYISPAMEWGVENEIFARNAYEVEVSAIETIGFALHSTIKRFGASPDGLVGPDGLVEFKCPNTSTHIEYILRGVVPAEYHWQMLAEMACAERQWCDFVSYDPRLPKKLQLFVRRFPRDEQRIAEMEVEVVKFLAEVDEQIDQLTKRTLVDLDPTLCSKLNASIEKLTKEARHAVSL